MGEAEISFVIHPSQREKLWQKEGADNWAATEVAVKIPKLNSMFVCARITTLELIILSCTFLKVLAVLQLSVFNMSKINIVHRELGTSWAVKTENHSSFKKI